MKIVLISGKAGAGKDTAAGFINDYMYLSKKPTLIIHYADLLKFVCQKYLGWNGKKDEAGRTLLQHIGTDVVRAKNPNYWADWVIEFLDMFGKDVWEYVLIPDVRFPNEVTRVMSHFGNENVIHVDITRPGNNRGLTEEQLNHSSENAMVDMSPDYTIVNSGTMEEFERTVLHWVVFALDAEYEGMEKHTYVYKEG